MNESYYRITLDIKSIQSQISLPIKQGDTSRGIYISLTDGGKPYTIARGCYAIIKGEKSDGTEIGNNCYIENNRIVYPITQHTVSAPGIVECEVSLYNAEGGIITSPRFTLIVDAKAVGSDKYTSSSEYKALEKYLSEVRAAEEERQGVFDYWQNIIRVVDSPKLWELEAGLYKVTTGFYTTETDFITVSSNPEESCYVHIMLNHNGFAFYMRSTYELTSDADITEQGLCPSFEWGITNGTTWEKGVLQNNSFLVKETDDIETYSKSRTRYPSVRAMYNFVTNKLALKEDVSNKVGAVAENNKNDGLHYPTVKAMCDYVDKMMEDIDLTGNFATEDELNDLKYISKEEETLTSLVEDFKTTANGYQGVDNQYKFTIVPNDVMVVGRNYRVVLNGTTYNLTGKEWKNSSPSFRYVGNLALVFGKPNENDPFTYRDTGESFCIGTFHGISEIFAVTESDAVLSLYEVETSEVTTDLHTYIKDLETDFKVYVDELIGGIENGSY